MATKVTRKIYKQIKTEIDTSMKLGIIPTHKDKRRSKKRLKQYNRIARYYNLSINTIRGIGKSNGYADYHRIMQGYKLSQPKTRFTHATPEKPITITLPTPTVESVARLRRDLYAAINEISDLQSEMAIIKAKKGRWFKNGQTTSKK